MSTFVYMTRCDGCGHCVDICPSDIMHIDENIRRAVNIEPNFCWECYSCVKACPNHAIDVRGYADFAPMGHWIDSHAPSILEQLFDVSGGNLIKCASEAESEHDTSARPQSHTLLWC